MTTSIYHVTVEFGDCDPAGIVFYPNYYRWFDAASHHLFDDVGMNWRELRDRYGAVGFPLIETGATYRRSASCGDRLEIESQVIECTHKLLRVQHLIHRNDELVVDGFELRFLGAPHPDDPARLRMLEITEEMQQAICGGSDHGQAV